MLNGTVETSKYLATLNKYMSEGEEMTEVFKELLEKEGDGHGTI